METITRKIKRNGRRMITIELPDNFKADNIEVTIKSDYEETKSSNIKESDNEKLRSELREFYSSYKVDLSKFKFNRDELHER